MTTKVLAAECKRPNILWLVSEDNNPMIGAYGDKLARTPTIDQLASKGVLFRNAYSNAPVCAPSRFAILTGVYPESCAPANHMRAVGELPKQFQTYPEILRAAGYYCTNNSKTDYNCNVDPKALWNAQGAKAHWRQRPEGQPFMAVFNYEATHESQIFKPTAGRVTPEMITVPPFLPDTPGTRQDFASYHNLIETMDSQIAERLAELEADGLSDDTIVFLYSDNGGVLGRSKRYCYDEGLRCALIVYAPPKWRHLLPSPPGSEVTSPVSLIDLAPTLCTLAGVPQPAQMGGKSILGRNVAKQRYAFGMRNRMDERIDFQRTVTDGRWRYIRNYMPHRPWGQHQAFAWLAKGYQEWEAAHSAGTLDSIQDRFFQVKPYEELYDLTNDPDQVRNLAGNLASASVLARLSDALDTHMRKINDNGFLPETMEGEGYIQSRDERVYPLARVMELAAAAARGQDNEIGQLIDALSSHVAVLRYWGATGLLVRGSRARNAVGPLQLAMRSDTSPFVKIVCAEAVANLVLPDEPVGILTELLDNSPVWQVQLHALNALTFLGEAAMPAKLAIEKAAISEQEYLRNAGRYAASVLNGSYTPSSPIFDFEWLMKRLQAAT